MPWMRAPSSTRCSSSMRPQRTRYTCSAPPQPANSSAAGALGSGLGRSVRAVTSPTYPPFCSRTCPSTARDILMFATGPLHSLFTVPRRTRRGLMMCVSQPSTSRDSADASKPSIHLHLLQLSTRFTHASTQEVSVRTRSGNHPAKYLRGMTQDHLLAERRVWSGDGAEHLVAPSCVGRG
jgi:hypothetical protein